MADSQPKPPGRQGTRSGPSWTTPPPPKPRVLSPEFAKFKSQGNPSLSPAATTPTSGSSLLSSSSFLNRFRARYQALPSSVRRTFRVLRILAPVVPIGIFFSEHILQVMWVRGPSMSPYLNEDYAEMQTKSDMVLVNMWPWQQRRRLERGMVVTFR
jgi:inner membrane protease subunit 2